ncbi:MAG: hypothetical protein LIO92_11555 [Clostridiales bacterium]|nr:hypothetical protein [Clostridiales bacterium]
MILPMKKVSILVLDQEKEAAMRRIRQLGLVHIDTQSFSGEKMARLKDETSDLEEAIQTIRDLTDKKALKDVEMVGTPDANALSVAKEVVELAAEKNACRNTCIAAQTELDPYEGWGDLEPKDFEFLAQKGIALSMYEVLPAEYGTIGEEVKTLLVGRDKKKVRMLVIEEDGETDKGLLPSSAVRLPVPSVSTKELRQRIEEGQKRIEALNEAIRGYAKYIPVMEEAAAAANKEMEFEGYLHGMETAELSDIPEQAPSVAILNGYVPEEDLKDLLAVAKENAWGIISDDPTIEDNAPTKLRNNRFVSLIYPLTDFLGTVPGYFEQDISGWFLVFMLVFFGIIFGDGGYGLLIAAVAGLLLLMDRKDGKPASSLNLLILLFGLATIVWGTLTCTWFGLEVEQIPQWLRHLSLPVISNVYEDNMWYPFWTNGEAGLTTAQNLQIFCFLLALVQLSIAHILGIIHNHGSLKMLGDVGSLMQLWGVFYVVLTLVVNGEVFGLGRVINGIPVGTVAIVLVAAGFIIYFIFNSYEGSIKDSVLDSAKNIVSMLLGIVNVFSDIVSYIRLWAVGLAGAAISATVNEMAGPMFGRLVFIVFAVILLVFGHGLNMILNVLSVIVHGVRLNTLEFSSHMGISWSGHKYEPFKE